MNRFWDPVIKPILGMVNPERIVEVGSDKGVHTRKLLSYCCEQGHCVLHVVDPAPKFDVADLQEQHGGHLRFHRMLSLEALALIDRFDVVLLDGDHNWYTVFHELDTIDKRCRELGQPFPLVFLHDVGWPYARRDLYYNPDTIPPLFRKPHAKMGLRQGSVELQPDGGLNSGMHNAMTEGDARNGVLSAVEDFMVHSEIVLDLITLPGLHGLGILFRRELRREIPELAQFLDGFRLTAQVKAYIDQVEHSRVDSETARLEHAVALNRRERELQEVRQQLQDVQQLQVTWASERQRLEGEIAAREREIAHLQSLVENMNERIALLGQLGDKERQNSAREMAARDREIADLRVWLSNTQEELEQQRVAWEADRTRLEADLVALSEQAQKSEVVTELETQLSQAQTELARQASECAALKQRMGRANQEIKTLQTSVTRLKSVIWSLKTSTSWRLTAPMRWVGERVRRGSAQRRTLIEPVKDLVWEEGWFRSTGKDPQFKVKLDSNDIPTGWVYLQYSAVAEEALLKPTLYVDLGHGYSEATAIRLPHHGSGRHGWVIRLPEHVRALRFDPLERTARFRLEGLRLRPLGKPELAMRLVWDRVRPVWAQPSQLLRLVGTSWSLVRSGNVAELKRRLLMRVAEPSCSAVSPVAASHQVNTALEPAWRYSPPAKVKPYRAWLDVNTWTDRSLKHLEARLAGAHSLAKVSVVLPVDTSQLDSVEGAVFSLVTQVYANWELLLLIPPALVERLPLAVRDQADSDSRVRLIPHGAEGRSERVNQAAEHATGSLLAFMDPLDRLAPDALAEVVLYASEHPDVALLYADEDEGSPDLGYDHPCFKPGWSPERLLCENYVGSFVVCDRHLFTAVGGVRAEFGDADLHDFLLRMSEREIQAVHLPLMLNHKEPGRRSAGPEVEALAGRAIQEALVRRGTAARATHSQENPAAWPVFTHEFPDTGPRVAIILAVEHAEEADRLLVELAQTSYQNTEVVLVGYDSAALAALQRGLAIPARTICVDRLSVKAGRSHLFNLAANQVDAEQLLFLSFGVQIDDPRWLSRLVGYGQLAGVGATGAMPTRTQRGHSPQLRNTATLSDSCLLTSRSLFMRLGGFDEARFEQAQYVSDYCYRVADSGLRCVAVSGLRETPTAPPPSVRDAMAASALRGKYHGRQDPFESPHLDSAGEIIPRKLAVGPLPPIRTLVFSHNLSATEGAPNSLFEVVVALKQRGILDPVVYSPSEGLLRQQYEQQGIRVVVGHNPTKNGSDPKAFERAIERLTSLMKSLRVELVYANTLQTYYGIIAAKRLGLPAVWNPRESEHWLSYYDFLAPQVRRQAYECFQYPYRVVFVAHATSENWAPLNSRSNYTVIQNGLNMERLEEQAGQWSRQSARTSLQVNDDEVMVLLPGTITERKGQEDLVLALKQISPEAAAKVRCYLVGARPTPYSKKIADMVTSLPAHLEGRVHVVPETPDIARYYKAADICVCTSRVESYPRIVLEAMAFGLPIVSTPVFGIREQVWDGVNGLFYNVGEPLQLAERLDGLILDEERRHAMGASSRHVLATLNDCKEMCDQYAQVMREAYLSKGKALPQPTTAARKVVKSGTDLSIMTISRSLANLDKLMGSIRNSQHELSLEILLAWNGQEDPDAVRKRYDNLPLRVFHITPYNFARNNNELFRHSIGDASLFINDDIELDVNSLQRAWNALQKPGIGLVGANLRYPNGKIQHAGVMFRPDGRPYHRFKHELPYDDPAIAESCTVPAITGAFMLMHRSDFSELLFDESFRVAGEDIDLCLRFRRLVRKEIWYAADATAVHHEGVTRKTTGERLTPPEDMCKIVASWHAANAEAPQVEVVAEAEPKIRIVTEKPGWILHRKALEIQRHLPNVRINEEWDDADIHYYINYGYFDRRPKNGIVVANFTHYDPDKLGDKFISVAQEVDHCTAVSLQTVDHLKQFGVPDEKISLIVVGADKSFRPKMTLGIVGRTYPGGRKGEHLVQALLENPEVMDGLQIVSTHEGWGVPVWRFDTMADFYRSIDYLLVPSLIEGGPVPFMEALACGTPSIAPPIGVIPMFPHIEYPVGDLAGLTAVIQKAKHEFHQSKRAYAQTIEPLDWRAWAMAHQNVFRMLMAQKGPRP